MIGLLQYLIWLAALQAALLGLGILYVALGPGRGFIQQLIALVIGLASGIAALILAVSADQFAARIATHLL